MRLDPEVLTLKSLCRKAIGDCLRLPLQVQYLPLPAEQQRILKEYVPAVIRPVPQHLKFLYEDKPLYCAN